MVVMTFSANTGLIQANSLTLLVDVIHFTTMTTKTGSVCVTLFSLYNIVSQIYYPYEWTESVEHLT